MKELTEKQEQFCLEYMKDRNATRASQMVGHSTCWGTKQLKDVDVQARLQMLTELRNVKVGIDAEYVLRQAVKIHERCMQEITPVVNSKGEQVLDEAGCAVYKFDAKSAIGALKLVGDHISVQAFRQQIHQTTVVAELSDEELNLRLAELINANTLTGSEGILDRVVDGKTT